MTAREKGEGGGEEDRLVLLILDGTTVQLSAYFNSSAIVSDVDVRIWRDR